jgi:hypothetical protein
MITLHLISKLKIVAVLTALCCMNATAAPMPEHPSPFWRFAGEWTLKEDRWSHNWGQGDETIKIANHHTVFKSINTNNSILSVVDHPEPHGHILWSYSPATKRVHHLSSFGAARNGVGEGTLSEAGDLTLKIIFSDGAPGTYRIYTYRWISEDEYEMLSKQYDANDAPTGIFYGGTFIRIQKYDTRATIVP